MNIYKKVESDADEKFMNLLLLDYEWAVNEGAND